MIQFIKYSFVGLINLIISLGLFLLLLKVFFIEYMFSFTITWLVGIFLTYVINFLWVFKADEKLEFQKRLPKYFLIYLFSYSINILFLRFLVNTYGFDPFWIQFLIMPLVVFINFFGFKLWALK